MEMLKDRLQELKIVEQDMMFKIKLIRAEMRVLKEKIKEGK